MVQAHGIGVLATVEAGEPRLRPMEFSLVDGELWAATSKRSSKYAEVPDGQRVEVLFMNGRFDHARLRGVLQWSTDTAERHRLWDIQLADIGRWYDSPDDPNLVILKIVPTSAEYKLANGDDRYCQEAI